MIFSRRRTTMEGHFERLKGINSSLFVCDDGWCYFVENESRVPDDLSCEYLISAVVNPRNRKTLLLVSAEEVKSEDDPTDLGMAI